MLVNDEYDFDKAEIYSGMKCQDVQMQKDQLIVETADMLKVPLFTAEALLKINDWNRKKLLDNWMNDKGKMCDKAGVPVPPDDSTSVDSINVGGNTSTSGYEVSCEICMIEYIPSPALYISCRHNICADCWSEYLTRHITENPAANLECPGYDCSILVPNEIIEAAVSKDVAQRYLQFGIRTFVDTHPEMKWCPYPGCGRAVQLPDNPNMTFNYNGFILKTRRTKPAPRAVDCGSGHFFCWNCLDEAHEPCDCDLWNTWQKEIALMKPQPKDMELAEHRANTVANSLWLITYSKPCPKCKSPIEKTEGCNHMKCVKCKHEFCWVCMEAWKIHSSETGGYFRCNKYNAVDKFNNTVADAKREIVEEHKKASKFQRFMHYYMRYHNHEVSHKLEEPLLSTAKMKMLALSSVVEDDPKAAETSFIENSIKELLKARRVLRASYPYGYYLQDGMHRKVLFESMQNELEDVTETLSQMVARAYLRTPRSRIIETAQALQQKRLKFVNSVANGLVPSSPSIQSKMKSKRPPIRKKPRDPFFDDDSDDTEDALIRLAITESLLENASKIPDTAEAVAFAPYARCIRYGCPLPRADDGEDGKQLYCGEYCRQMDSYCEEKVTQSSSNGNGNIALALQLNHEENHEKPIVKCGSSGTDKIACHDTESTSSVVDSVSQVLDSFSGKVSFSDKTSKCNLYISDSPLPMRSTESPKNILLPKKDSLLSLKADNLSTLSYSVWERGSVSTNEVPSLSNVSSLCNLICMETGRFGIMSRSHSPVSSVCNKTKKNSNENKTSYNLSLQLFALLLDNVNVQRKYLHFRSYSLPVLPYS